MESLGKPETPNGSGVSDLVLAKAQSPGTKYSSLLEQPGPQKFKLFRLDRIYKARKFKVLPLAI